MKKVLKWKVGETPSGAYRAFERRAWPTADHKETGDIAIVLICDDEYIPAKVKSGNHAEITIRVAQYHNIPEGRGRFIFRTLERKAKTLKEAKDRAEAFIKDNPDFQP